MEWQRDRICKGSYGKRSSHFWELPFHSFVPDLLTVDDEQVNQGRECSWVYRGFQRRNFRHVRTLEIANSHLARRRAKFPVKR